MEDEERLRKLEAGKAKLAQFRQRKARSDGQKTKRKKQQPSPGSRYEVSSAKAVVGLERARSDEVPTDGPGQGPTHRAAPARGGTQSDQAYAVEPESEISTTADGFSSEVNGCSLGRTETPPNVLREEEGEFGVGEVFSERGAQDGQARLEAAETELARRLQEIEELSRELEEARAAYGPEGLQQLQEFEAAITQRDGIISQLTAHLQQARREKDETMREFLELTEQSQKLQLQFQHLQASETLRNSTHSSTAADLLQARQQAAMQQQQLEEQGRRLVDCQKQQQEFQKEIAILEEKIRSTETECLKQEQESRSRELEKEAAIEVLKARLAEEEERHSLELKDHGLAREKQLEALREQMARQDREVASARLELAQTRQREQQSSEEVRRLMGSVEELQQRQHAGGWAEQEAQRRLEQLRAELEETHGQQIVQMKKELTRQHHSQTEALRAQHQAELERATARDPGPPIDELSARLHEALAQRDGLSQDLLREREAASAEKSTLGRRLEELQAELDLVREQGRLAGADLERRLGEALSAVDDLKTQAATAAEVTRDLQAKHEAEVTNYRIKLEMLEREKDAVLDRMAEAQEADLDSLRTQLLFRHEEELSRLREDLEGEHRANVARLKESLGLHHEQQLEGLRAEMRRQLEALQLEKDGLVTRQNQLLLELSALREVQQSPGTSEAEETALRLRELQKEVEGLRRGENEKGTLELEVQELQLKAELLEKELREKEALLREGLSRPGVGDGDGPEEVLGLTEENRRLTQQCAQLKEEVDRQRDTFSFAEKNFEVNYQELREEYACLLKLKADLEEGRSRQEAEHREKVQALTQELRRLRASGRGAPQDAGAPGVETAEPGEVVEKDTTELMEKLEVTQREKLELSERLSALSGQLDQKHREVDRLHGQVDSLQREKDQLLVMCRELEAVAQRQGADLHGTPVEPEPDGAKTAPREFPQPPSRGARESRGFGDGAQAAEARPPTLEAPLPPGPGGREGNQQTRLPVKQPHVGHLGPQVTGRRRGRRGHRRASEAHPGAAVQKEESDHLRRELGRLEAEQADLRLQMEAQRLCLSLVHSTHLAHVREAMESEREQALSSLKEELASAHTQELEELQEVHRLELRTLPGHGAVGSWVPWEDSVPESSRGLHSNNSPGWEVERPDAISPWTGDAGVDSQILIGKLWEAVSEECASFTQSFLDGLGEPSATTPQQGFPVEDGGEAPDSLTPPGEEPGPKVRPRQAEDLRADLRALVSRISQEHSRLLELQTRLAKGGKEVGEWPAGGAEAGRWPEVGESRVCWVDDDWPPAPAQTPFLPGCTEPSRLASSSGGEPAGEIGRPESCSQPLSGDTSAVGESNVQHCVRPVSPAEPGQGNRGPGWQMQQHVDPPVKGRVIPEDEPDADVVRQLEQRYQERLQEEVAKVIVSMSVTFAQQSEQARLSGLREAHAPGRRTHAPFQPEQSLASEMELADSEPAPPPWGAHVSTFQEELKALSQGLSEDKSRKILVLGSERGDGELELEARELACAGEIFPKDQDFVLKDMHDVPEASRQLRLHEEKLEDLRQELVRQCEEHQQVTERLRQAHMRQMERQREDQEQLQEEIHRLNRQLAQSSSVDTENLVSERERVLLEELESLKQRALEGREQLCFQVHSRSTQTQLTQEEPDLSEEAQEPIPSGEERERNAEDTAPDGLSAERHALRQANRRLLKGLLEVAKTTVAAEETIGRHVLGMLNRSGGGPAAEGPTPPRPCETHPEGDPAAPFLEHEGPGHTPDPWTEAPGGGEDLCQLVLRSGSAGPDMGPESEELALNVSSRLQAAVEKLLDAINTTSDQLEHARVAQTELLRESSRQTQEAAELLRCQEELQERLREEGKAREQLAEELSKAEGVIDGYADDKALLEREVLEKTDVIGRLEQELLRAGNRLQELEAERQQVQEEKALLSRQKEALSAEAGPAEQRLLGAAVHAALQAEFLQETEKLAKEKLDVQRQAEKERDDLQKQVRTLEVDVEEQVSRFLELEQEKNAELVDLRQQNQALEKQLEKTRKFLDEQAVDREHERDVFQQEIQKLEEQLKAVPRFQPVSEEQAREVEQLTEQLKEKTDRCSEGLLAAEQLQRDLQERDDQLDRLGCRLRELEQALVLGSHGRPEVEEQQQAGAADGKGELALEAQLQVEREAVDRKEKEITNLEEQLEQFREELENKNEEVQQLHMQLEIQKKESTTRLAELQMDNQLFKEELGRLGLAVQGSEGTLAPDPHLIVGKFARILQEKELDIQELNEQMAKLQQQLETAADNKVIEEKNELLRELEAQVECLKSDQERVKKRSQEEVEQLNDVIEKLQEELAGLGQKESVGGALPQGGADSLKQQLEAALAGDTEAVALGAADTVALERQGQAPAKEVVVSGLGPWAGETQQEQDPGAPASGREISGVGPQGRGAAGSLSGLQQGHSEGFVSQDPQALAEEQPEAPAPGWTHPKLKGTGEQAPAEMASALLEAPGQRVAAESQAPLWPAPEPADLQWGALGMPGSISGPAGEAVSSLGALTLRIAELEGQLADAQSRLLLEKEQLEIAKRSALEKEADLQELKTCLAQSAGDGVGAEDGHGPHQGTAGGPKGHIEEAQVRRASELVAELVLTRAELMAAREQLTSSRLQVEKLQEELMGRESQAATLQEELERARDRLAGALRREEELAALDGRRSSMPSPDQAPSGLTANGQEPVTQALGLEERHSAETQVSERERVSTVQLLTEECATLRVLGEWLKAKEGVSVPGLAPSDSSQTRGPGSSDSSSDWSQGICLAQSQGFDTASEGLGDEAESSADSFPKKIKGLLRAVHAEGVHVLSLTEPHFPETDPPAPQQALGPWQEERNAYLSTISSLRALIATMREPEPPEGCESPQAPASAPDWRSELLRALQDTFLQEWGLLLAALQTELAVRGAEDARGLLGQLERRLQEQGRVHAAALDRLLAADRRSLLMEVHSLRDQMGRSSRAAERDSESGLPRPGSLEKLGEAGAGAPWERMDITELKNQLAQVRLELATALQARHRQAQELEALRAELQGKKDEVDVANDSLATEQRKGRELRWALEKAEAQAARSQDRGREELEDLRLSLEDQVQRNVELSHLVTQQQQQLNDLQQKTESQETVHAAQLSAERGWSAELQRLLDSERAREPEGSTVAEQGGTHAPLPAQDGAAAEEAAAELRRQVQEQQRRLEELVREVEASRLESLQAGQQLERERQAQGAALQAAQETQARGQQRLQALQARVEELQVQLDGKTQQVCSLERECRRLQGIVQDLRNQQRAQEGRRGAGRAPDPMFGEEQAPWDLPSDRTRNWVLQQKTDGVGVNGEDGGAGECPGPVQQTMQQVALRLERLAQKASSRLPFDPDDDEDFAWLQRDVDSVIFQLLKWSGPVQPGEELTVGTPGGPGLALTERLLRQSAELTGHISRLTAEKNDLRHAILKLEEEVRWYRQRGSWGGDDDPGGPHLAGGAAPPDALPACERQAWGREKAALQRALRRAQAELGRLKAELRNETLLRDLGLGLDPDSAVLKRMYSRFLRAEGYRKALIYQKKYLLLLLGGFQACEEATLVLISRMAGQPAPAAPETGPPPPPALTRFRSAARVSIAISRMRFLVRRWQRLAGSGPTVTNREGPGSGSGPWLPPGPELGVERTCLTPAGLLELLVEQRAATVASCRYRADGDRPHSAGPFPHRFPTAAPADLSPASLACSQLQNYDPDRALTDYISRLEALQRRLGSAQPGSSTVHAGGRR
ncbi:A-kinase anchor protein 9 isoform X3 [Tachyglossus aculeatus]|uniref:A-kinase anchor protein 9 isoform X3 n=1 Tax=Tachyglossus aculeatus TaxID=9261 RepID=UPI0018F4134A|nr:A-kinase anchor protein 9 isoform X3 [Tachyglossus aculeatus]